jgi:hypothetical protein
MPSSCIKSFSVTTRTILVKARLFYNFLTIFTLLKKTIAKIQILFYIRFMFFEECSCGGFLGFVRKKFFDNGFSRNGIYLVDHAIERMRQRSVQREDLAFLLLLSFRIELLELETGSFRVKIFGKDQNGETLAAVILVIMHSDILEKWGIRLITVYGADDDNLDMGLKA